jgi:cytochrome P450 family 6
VVKKGMRVEMPIYASHYDEDFFPNPTLFEPERFLKENSKNIVPMTFRPFGGKLCTQLFYQFCHAC